MRKILIVDDERIIVDGLCEMLADRLEGEHDLLKAYSGVEALGWLDRTRIDIVVTDIRMPELSGIELQREIAARWPRCKVIFLTGYHDFHYIQSSVRGGAIDYVLKTEGDGAIKAAVDKACRMLDEELASSEMLLAARKQVALAKPALSQSYLADLLEGEASDAQRRAERFAELELALCPRSPVYLLLGRIDQWREDDSPSDKALLRFAIHNIAAEYLGDGVRAAYVLRERNQVAWFMQPSSGIPAGDWPWIRYVHGTVEQIQAACKQYLKLSCSFAAASEMCEWEEVAGEYRALSALFAQGIGLGSELFVTLARTSESSKGGEEGRSVPRAVSLLYKYAEDVDRAAFMSLYREITEIGNGELHSGFVMELYYSLVAALYTLMNRWKIARQLAEALPLDRIGSLASHGSWEEARRYLERAFECLFDNRRTENERQIHEVVRKLHEYIGSNLDGDVSLSRLAEIVYLSPTYLSRFYKQTTGAGLQEYILEARLKLALSLLEQPQYKIHEIGARVGFASAPYFTRFIRKALGMSPQEYRDRRG